MRTIALLTCQFSSRGPLHNALLQMHTVKVIHGHRYSLCVLLFARFTLLAKHTVEFNQVAMANSEGSEAMLNRVMTKDNIGVCVLLEVHKDLPGGGECPYHLF